MDQILDYFASYLTTNNNNNAAILTLFIAALLFCRFLMYLFKNRNNIKDFFNNLYARRRRREELLEKLNSSYDKAVENADAITSMQNNYVQYHKESVHIRNDLADKMAKIADSTSLALDSIKEINHAISNVTDAQIESLNDRITQKCRYYTSLGGIPEDEIEDFQRIFDTYKKIGGNHGLELRFNKTKELPIIPKSKED